MKVLYDHQIFQYQDRGGISRYFCDLIQHIERKGLFQTEVSIKRSKNAHYRKMVGHDEKVDWISDKLVRTTYKFEMNQKESLRRLKERDFDVFHATYYNDYFVEKVDGYVIDVHDMIYERLTQFRGLDEKMMNSKARTLRAASVVLSNSESTKKDLVDILSIPKDDIVVISRGDSFTPIYEAMVQQGYSMEVPERYILFVGGRGLYKNFSWFLKSVAKSIKARDVSIIAVGGGPLGIEELKEIEILGLTGLVKQMTVDDLALAYLYANATMLAIPSLYEGFGLPVLEAFACGCPVVMSGTSSLPEVGGEAGIYFDPFDEKDIDEKTAKVLDDDGLRRRMVENGATRLNLFKWDNVVERVEGAYRKSLN